MEQHIISDKSIYIESSGVIDSHDYMNHLFKLPQIIAHLSLKVMLLK